MPFENILNTNMELSKNLWANFQDQQPEELQKQIAMLSREVDAVSFSTALTGGLLTHWLKDDSW